MAQGLCGRPGMTITGSETSKKMVLVILKPVQSSPRAAAVSHLTKSLLQTEKGCDCHSWHLLVLDCWPSVAKQLVQLLSTWSPEAVVGRDRVELG